MYLLLNEKTILNFVYYGDTNLCLLVSAKKSVPTSQPSTTEPVATEPVVLKSTPPSTSSALTTTPAPTTTPVTKAAVTTTTNKAPVPPPVHTEKRPLRSSSTSRIQTKFQNGTDEDKGPKAPAVQTLQRTLSKVKPGGGANTSTATTENLSPSRLKPVRSINPEGKSAGSPALTSGSQTVKPLAHVNTAPGKFIQAVLV